MRFSFRVEHGFKMSEVLEGSGGAHKSMGEEGGDNEDNVLEHTVGQDGDEFTLQSLRNLVVDGLR